MKKGLLLLLSICLLALLPQGARASDIYTVVGTPLSFFGTNDPESEVNVMTNGYNSGFWWKPNRGKTFSTDKDIELRFKIAIGRAMDGAIGKKGTSIEKFGDDMTYTLRAGSGMVTFYLQAGGNGTSFSFTIDASEWKVKDATIDENAEKNNLPTTVSNVTALPFTGNVTIKRTFFDGVWNTLVLPFDMTKKQFLEVFGENTKVKVFDGSSYAADNKYTLEFYDMYDSSTSDDEQVVFANCPALITGATPKDAYIIKDITWQIDTPTDESTHYFDFVGTYDRTTVPAGNYYISSDNKIYIANGTEQMKPMRAYFHPENLAAAAAKEVVLDLGDGTTTSISALDKPATAATPADAPCYNLNGQRVDSNYRGIVICSGKKFTRR